MTARIYQAVFELLVEGGAQSCSLKAVAERAGVERSTLHRRFSGRWDMIIEAFMAKGQAEIVPDDAGSFAGDLKSVLTRLVRVLESPLGPALVAAAGELRGGANPQFARSYFERRMEQLDPMFDRAIARGELRADVRREELFTFAAAPLYFRFFIAAQELDESFVDHVVASVCWLYCSPSSAAKLSLPARIA